MSLPRQRLADQIADALREQMLTGVLPPGQPIHERETSESLGVSRTPLREAILILEAEGLIETSPARSPIVVNPTIKELTDLLAVQAALEAVAGEQACANASDADIARVRDLHDTMIATQDSADPVTFFRTDMAFHEAIVAATYNQSLIKTHKQYNSRLWRARYMASSRKQRTATSMDQHGQIVRALEDRDAKRAAKILRLHLSQAVDYIISHVETGTSANDR